MDPNQPSGPGAPTGTPSQGQPSGPSGATGADANQQQPTLTFDSFDEDQKKYLAGQGITKQEELTQDALLKVINHARSSQQTLSERQAELDRIRAAAGTQNQPTGPTDVPGGPTGAPGTTQPQSKGLNEFTAFQLASTLSSQYPKLKDKLTDGSFYEEMKNAGYPLLKDDGEVHLANLQQFATRRTQEIELEEKIAEANKPGDIPAPNGNNTPALDASTEMTVEVARAIVLQDPSNARFAEAQKFLENSRKK